MYALKALMTALGSGMTDCRPAMSGIDPGLPRAAYGMTLAHFGMAVMVAGISASAFEQERIEALSRGDGPARVLVALGYAGWEPGQLEDELAQNSWLTVPVDRGIVFDTPLEDRWRAAARQLGVDLSTLTDYSGHA